MDSLDVKNGVAYLHPEDGSSPAYAEGNWAAEYARKLMDAEETARENMDKTLQGQIETEAQERQAADAGFDKKIEYATIARQNLHNEIESKIRNEALERGAADKLLNDKITDEAAARETMESTLQEMIEINESNISAETASRKRAIAEETAAREAADKSLQTQITAEKQVRESTDRYNKLKNLADYEVTYYEYEANRFAMIVNSKQNFNDTPLGLYILSPAQDVDLIFVETTDGYNTQVYSGELRKGNTYIIDFQLEGRKLIHTIKAGGLKNFADYDVEYLEQGAYSYDLYVYTNNTIDNFPYGQYIFSPALDVGNVVIYTKNGDVIQSYNNNLFAGNTYIIDFQLEGRKLIHTIKSQEDSGSLGGVTGGSSSEELKWQLLETVTLMEDVDKYAFTLPAKCKGAIVSIRLGKNLTMTAGQLYVRSSSNAWAGSRYFNALGATTNEKEIRLIVKPEHGYYYSYAVLRNGSSGSAISRYEDGSEFMTGDATKYNLTTIETNGLIIPEGAIIKIWGLIEE